MIIQVETLYVEREKIQIPYYDIVRAE